MYINRGNTKTSSDKDPVHIAVEQDMIYSSMVECDFLEEC